MVRSAIPDFLILVKDLWKELGIVDDEIKKGVVRQVMPIRKVRKN